MTHGYPGDFIYRFRLWQALTQQGVEFDFVGHRSDLARPAGIPVALESYADPRFDRDHSGEGGSRFHSLRFPLADTLQELESDVVVVMMGVNDLREGRSALSISGVAERFVQQVRDVDPEIDVVLAHASQSQYRSIRDYNARLDRIAPRLSTTESQVVTAGTSVGYTVDDMWDHLHPNAVGEVKIARAVHSALVEIGVAPGTPVAWPSPTPGPVLPATDLRATASRGAVRLDWQSAPGATHYAVAHRNTTRNGPWATVLTTDPSTTTTVRSLVPNETYTFAVRPVKGRHPSESRIAATVSVRAGDGTVTRPPAPAQPQVTVSGTTITLTWPEALDHGGAPLTQYLVRRAGPNGAQWFQVPPTQRRLVLANQPRGHHTFQLHASNRAGNSPASTPRSVMIAVRPAAPAQPEVKVSGRQATISWSPPRDTGGSPLTGYVVQYGNRYVSLPASSRSLTLKALPRGPLDIRVYATNAQGHSPASPTRRITLR